MRITTWFIFCKANLFKGEIHIATHFNASNVLINANIFEVEHFRSRIDDDPSFRIQESLGQIPHNISNEFDNFELKTLEDVHCLEILLLMRFIKTLQRFLLKALSHQIYPL
ncbi:hypothetical protein AAHA92_24382 [Salvia divinorum]|uniref:Uncharacterized protein n=1 Tax=Salvia divinorum TaxID=28513 RepID=A0ABD1G8A2_SALDI